MDVDIQQQSLDYIIIADQGSESKEKNIDLDNPPKISFCIPTLNNEDTIDACLSSIKDQDYADIEIIIIDGYSKDKTIEIAKNFADLILYDQGTYGSACQTGFKHASGEVIALFDSDIIIPHKTWLREAIRYFNFASNVSTVWPLLIAPPNSSLFARLYQTNLHRIFIEHRIANKIGLYGGGNSLFLRSCLEEIGGINPSIHWGADFEWAQKLKNLGYCVVYLKDPVYHDTMRTFGLFVRKQFSGAKTFTKHGFQFMGLSFKDIFYEHFILGTKGMIKGIIIDRDVSWCLYPLVVSARGFAYGYTYLVSMRRD
ncbi:glycosyltransferase [Methanofollis formosanus]|uniref:Glycosyltransferase n=1 Tax=Methanofollis formosanus TaxID=299308 RepID=A0A8G1A104_9EURY|nr:glycosyltransferase [Methanofollis formosanus]QYZ78453.1 glycosyltransferase [Methanofollis formosanus]